MRKIIALFLMACLFTFTIGSSVYADDLDEIIEEVEETNEKIQEKIDQAIKVAETEMNITDEKIILLENEKAKLENEGASEEKIEEIDAIIVYEKLEFEKKLDNIIQNLINVTNSLAAEMIEEAADEGVDVMCEYELVIICGREAWIDPLRIVGF